MSLGVQTCMLLSILASKAFAVYFDDQLNTPCLRDHVDLPSQHCCLASHVTQGMSEGPGRNSKVALSS